MCVGRPETAILRILVYMSHVSVNTCRRGPGNVAKCSIHPLEAVARRFAVKEGFLSVALFVRCRGWAAD